MSFDKQSEKFQELLELEQEISEIEMDLQSNVNRILSNPKDMKFKIETLQKLLKQNHQRLDFFRKSVIDNSEEYFKRIKELEKKIAIVENQIELNLKVLKKL